MAHRGYLPVDIGRRSLRSDRSRVPHRTSPAGAASPPGRPVHSRSTSVSPLGRRAGSRTVRRSKGIGIVRRGANGRRRGPAARGRSTWGARTAGGRSRSRCSGPRPRWAALPGNCSGLRSVRPVRSRGLLAPVVDADPDGPVPAVATAFVPGPTLRRAVPGPGVLPDRTLGMLATGLAEALATIHAAGAVHAGLRPDAVVLSGGRPVEPERRRCRPADLCDHRRCPGPGPGEPVRPATSVRLTRPGPVPVGRAAAGRTTREGVAVRSGPFVPGGRRPRGASSRCTFAVPVAAGGEGEGRGDEG